MYNVAYRENSIYMHCNWEYLSKQIFKDIDTINLEIKNVEHFQILNTLMMYIIKTDLEFIEHVKIFEDILKYLKLIWIISYTLDVMHHFYTHGRSISGININLAVEEYLNNEKLIYTYE